MKVFIVVDDESRLSGRTSVYATPEAAMRHVDRIIAQKMAKTVGEFIADDEVYGGGQYERYAPADRQRHIALVKAQVSKAKGEQLTPEQEQDIEQFCRFYGIDVGFTCHTVEE